MSSSQFQILQRGGSRGHRGRGGGRGGRGSSSGPVDERAPPGICRYYWSTGTCRDGFDCAFRHQAKPNVADTSTSAATSGSPLDFFSPEGLAVNNGSIINPQHLLRPSEAHNHMKSFLHNNDILSTPLRIEGFSRIFASINDRNKLWDSDSAQAFLDMIIHGNARFRMGDVLRFTPVSVSAGTDGNTLSFQRCYFPLFEYFASDLVLKSTMHENINSLYTLIEHNYDAIHRTTRQCVEQMIEAMTWEDQTPGLPPNRQNTLDGVVLFQTLSTVFTQFFSRFKQAIRNHPEVRSLVDDLSSWVERWSSGVSSLAPTFKDPITLSLPTVRNLTLEQIHKDVSRLKSIVDREFGRAEQLRSPMKPSSISPAERQQALITRVKQTYDPPGELREGGPRHDNDHANISDIRIAPTHEELMSSVDPYLPVFLPAAPHHLRARSMEKHLDVQFRLLREEMISSIRRSLNALHMDLDTIWNPSHRFEGHATSLEGLMDKGGGSYRTMGENTVFFHVYTNIRFAPVKAERQNFTIGLVADTPPGPARDDSAKRRTEYWEHSKRLQYGCLVALVLVSPGRSRVFLGTVKSMNTDIAESAKAGNKFIQLRVSFFDSELILLALRREPISIDDQTYALLLDNNTMFDSTRPFLDTLQTVEPASVPFAQYIARGDPWPVSMPVQRPKYARAPGFKFNLQCLLPRDQLVADLDVGNLDSIRSARAALHRGSSLDPSQVDAMIGALRQEVALIQGPPGTGKSFTGMELLRVLFASGIKPIVLIAYTNHALDHMLTSVLDAGITSNIVRLGSRSTSDRIAEYSLNKLEKLASQANFTRPLQRGYAGMKKIEEQMGVVMESIQIPHISSGKLQEYLNIHHPEQANSLFDTPPFWITSYFKMVADDEAKHGEWMDARTTKIPKTEDDPELSNGIYRFWKRGKDIEFIQPHRSESRQPPVLVSGPFVTRRAEFFASIGFPDSLPSVPSRQRDLNDLLEVRNVWSLSFHERRALSTFWEDEVRDLAYHSNVETFEKLRSAYEGACKNYRDVEDEHRRRLLSKTDLIGCTTTGAAKLISLLTSIAPKVVMVEEAGQVLESHVMAALVPSVEHLILIGDPAQLRPSVATFSLSMDSDSGQELYKFDRSLMERLADSGFPMSQLNVQRRMRPSISVFPRKIFYPRLEDNEIVHEYPSVEGVAKDVFFFSHNHPENAEPDSVSKFNMFEVNMIRDLVMYFLKQSAYNGAGDIAVLCAYLGQLQKVRAALRDLKIAVAVDERDEEELERQGLATEELGFDQVQVAKHIRLGTVDTFQGEEAKIVIISLVRNSGSFEEGRSIGFLKSINRINVALSRAKHGLFLFGNAPNLRKNPTWNIVLDEMEEKEQIGPGLPIVCPRHPEEPKIVTEPGQLTMHAPEGGCLRPCHFRLPCGHTCPSVCHADLDSHRRMKCDQPCVRVPCARGLGHVCPLPCSESCGDCQFPLYDILLPCGHVAGEVPCHLLDNLQAADCLEPVRKRLARCGHDSLVACSQDPATAICRETCGGTMSCCGRPCSSKCYQCQEETDAVLPAVPGEHMARRHHKSHPCERLLKCQHPCRLDCSDAHECDGKCTLDCRQRCTHQTCSKPCWEPCPPCMEPCEWLCPHAKCPVLCGSVCSRLPCDEVCNRTLACGHQCPSVCGEPCEQQTCVICLPQDRKLDVVDLIQNRTLGEIDLSSQDIGERLLTLECGHIYTVDTLDGHCHMSDYYERDVNGRYIRTQAPPTEYQAPPSCPTCRGPITTLRYGRVTKRGNLDILEQNVASTMSSDLDNISSKIQELSTKTRTLQDSAKFMVLKTGFKSEDEFDRLLDVRESQYGTALEPLPVIFLQQGKMATTHGLAPEEGKFWSRIVRDIVKAYKKVVEVAVKRGPHAQAYHAAVSTLYRLEIAAISSDPKRACDHPEPVAMAEVDKKIGQPPHKADMRFQVEAFFLSLEMRFLLAEVARSRIEGLPNPRRDDADALHHRRIWRCFVQFLYESCVKDARKSYIIASKSSALRLAARAAIHNLRAELERFRFDVLCDREEMVRNGNFDTDHRQVLVNRVQEQKTYTETNARKAENTYIQSKTTQGLAEEKAWFAETLHEKVSKYLKEYDDLANHLLTDIVYSPLSLQEKEDIVKAFNFSHRGHFYNCANGHAFVITECGGADDTATCPECGAPIGGSGHNLHSSNTRAMDLENIARGQGVQDPHWPWGAGA